MIDFVILFIFARKLYLRAITDGMNKWRWVFLVVVNWFMFELLGFSFLMSTLDLKPDLEFATKNIGLYLLSSAFALGCGILGYYITDFMYRRELNFRKNKS